jgi:hypothetical protein
MATSLRMFGSTPIKEKRNQANMSSSLTTCAFKGCSALRLQVAGTCSACRQEFCGRHRLAEQHECASVASTKAANARSWVLKSSDTGVKVDLVVGTLTPAGGFRWFMHAHADCTRDKKCLFCHWYSSCLVAGCRGATVPIATAATPCRVNSG